MDWQKLIFDSLSLFGVIAGLIYTGFQIRLLSNQYRDFHEWNRRKASHDSIDRFIALADGNKKLDEAFNYLTSKDPIPLKEIVKAINEEPELRAALHRLLNYLESLAIGVRHGVLDDDIIRDTFKGVFLIVKTQFSEYIDDRRRNYQSAAWSEIDLRINKWQEVENLPQRSKTGSI